MHVHASTGQNIESFVEELHNMHQNLLSKNEYVVGVFNEISIHVNSIDTPETLYDQYNDKCRIRYELAQAYKTKVTPESITNSTKLYKTVGDRGE